MRPLFAAIGMAVALCACTSAPKQTVELAEVVDQQIAQMQASHEKFVSLYYEGLRRDVDEFMAQKWTPQFLSNVIEGKGAGAAQFRKDLDSAYSIANVDWSNAVRIEGIEDPATRAAIQEAIAAVAVEQRGRLGVVLIDFANAAQKQIDLQRRKLLDPIDEQEAFVLDELRKGYADLMAGSASIKGYLASVVNVKEKSDAALQQLGLLDEQRKLIDSAIRVNEAAMDVLSQTEGAQQGINEAVEKLQEWRNQVRNTSP